MKAQKIYFNQECTKAALCLFRKYRDELEMLNGMIASLEREIHEDPEGVENDRRIMMYRFQMEKELTENTLDLIEGMIENQNF